MADEYFELLPDDFSESMHWKTSISTFETGEEQRRAEWTKPRTVYSFSYPNAINEQIEYIWEFYKARKGAYESFYLAVPPYLYHTETLVGSSMVVLTEAQKPSPANISVFIVIPEFPLSEKDLIVYSSVEDHGLTDLLVHENTSVPTSESDLSVTFTGGTATDLSVYLTGETGTNSQVRIFWPSRAVKKKQKVIDWTFNESEKKIIFEEEKTGLVIVKYVEMKKVRFLNDNLDRDWLVYLVTNQSIDFIEV